MQQEQAMITFFLQHDVSIGHLMPDTCRLLFTIGCYILKLSFSLSGLRGLFLKLLCL
jgi:hypothetical protein